jgi:hypothetical protein
MDNQIHFLHNRNMQDFSKSINPSFRTLDTPIQTHFQESVILSETKTHLYCHCPIRGNFYIEKTDNYEWYLSLPPSERRFNIVQRGTIELD